MLDALSNAFSSPTNFIKMAIGAGVGGVAGTKLTKSAIKFFAKKGAKEVLKKTASKVLITAGGGVGVAIGIAVAIWLMYEYMEQEKKIGELYNEKAEEILDSNDTLEATIDTNEAQNPSNLGYQTPSQLQGNPAAFQETLELPDPPTAEEMQQLSGSESAQLQEEAMNRFLAQLEQNASQEDIMEELQNANKIENPFEETIGENKEDVDDEIKEEIEEYEDELYFDKSEFDDLEGYKFLINNTLVTLYVKSDIQLISEDDNFQGLVNSEITSEKHTDKKGQTHATSKAYDIDGNQLDSVIYSTQKGYLEVGTDGANGTAKFSGTGNEDAYEVHGYGSTKFGKKEYEVSISGSYNLKESERDKETLLGTNSEIIADKEYKFRDDGAIKITESETNALFDTFTASVKWACDVMREVNLQSYTLDLGEADYVLGESDDEDIDDDEIEFEENGIKYTYNANATMINKETGATYFVKDLLDDEIATMEELIEKGFEPNEINGKEYTGKDDVDDAKTETKPKFTIKIDEPTTTENFEREVIYTDEDGQKYYFTTKCSHRYHIIDENGNEYTIQEALNIYTIKELMDNGLDCKVSAI